MNLAELAARGEAMSRELGREYYLAGSGLKRDPDFQAIYDRYSDLAGDDAIQAARRAGSPALWEWVVDVCAGRAVAPYEERQLSWEQAQVLRVNGCELAYLRAPIELANSPDRGFRIKLDEARSRASRRGLTALRRERFACERAVLENLGYADYVGGIATISGIDIDALARAAASCLDATAALYEDALRRLVKRRLGIALSELRRADIGWTFRADQFDAAFPSAALIDTANRQMQEMGLDATCGGRVRFDTDEREGKQPRAFCVTVQVPDEVYLVLRPRGGHNDYRTFWHELGHAMHFASSRPDLPFECRYAGDNSVTEGFAMLWDHLTLDLAWLCRYTRLSKADAATLVFELALNELYLLRRYAAKLLYEVELYRSDLDDMGARYAERLTEATRFRYPEDDYLLDVDPGFYAARYLRAWQLEAAFAGTLTQRFAVDWYRNPAAGEAVTDWMSRGQADPADRLAREALGVELSFDRVIGRLVPVLE